MYIMFFQLLLYILRSYVESYQCIMSQARILSKKVAVDLFYDIVSPYSYIGFEAICRYNRKFTGMDLNLRPTYIAAIMGETNNHSPAFNPAKAKYMGRDLLRLAKYFDIPFKMPENLRQVMFEKNTLSTMRLLTTVARDSPKNLENLTRELYLRVWSRDVDATTVESLKEACSCIGLPEKEIENLSNSIKHPDIKQELKDTTQVALDYGAFGLPVYVAHLEDGPKMFFGTDRLFLLAHYLNEPFPGPLKDLE